MINVLNICDCYNRNPNNTEDSAKINHRHMLFQVFLYRGSVNDPTKKGNKI